jgi:16S rRNA (adenine1518-N6/adenine1519-N6)-dimethyltransferase
MLPRERPATVDDKLLSEIVQVAFSQRRKLLRNTLGRWLDEKAWGGGFDLQRRAEEVPVDEYLALAAAGTRKEKRPE